MINKEQFVSDFIRVYPKAINPDMCPGIIKECRAVVKRFKKEVYRMSSRQNKIVDDKALMIAPSIKTNIPQEIEETIWKAIYKCVTMYLKEHWYLESLQSIYGHTMKYHEVSPGGGYHVWHTEHMSEETANRVLVVHLSLTDHDDEGDLEFLNWKKKVYPRAGQITIWPAAYTHYHRGNPVKYKSKCYITGWWGYSGFPNPKTIEEQGKGNCKCK